MTDTRELKNRFYDIADNGRYADIEDAVEITDSIGAPSAPETYDEVLATRVKRIKRNLRSPEFIKWADEILKAIEENKDNAEDLRGYKRNTHS
jgi:hypothetical protein